MKLRIFIYLLILLAFSSCNSRNINVDVDTSLFATSKDNYCSSAWFVWLPEGVFVSDSANYFGFEFSINKDEKFIEDISSFSRFSSTYDQYGYFAIDFYFEVDNIIYLLNPFMAGLAEVDGNSVSYMKYMSSPKNNPRILDLVKTTDKRLKIKKFKEIIKDCKLYAINPRGERLDFEFTKATEFIIYRRD